MNQRKKDFEAARNIFLLIKEMDEEQAQEIIKMAWEMLPATRAVPVFAEPGSSVYAPMAWKTGNSSKENWKKEKNTGKILDQIQEEIKMIHQEALRIAKSLRGLRVDQALLRLKAVKKIILRGTEVSFSEAQVEELSKFDPYGFWSSTKEQKHG